MLDPAEIARLKANADLVALFSADGHDGIREGSRTKVNCPFHVEHTPSCYIFDDGHFKCFGCGATGDAIEYVMRRRSLDFAKACEALGAAPQRATPAKIDRRRKYDVIMPVPAKAPKLNPELFTRDDEGGRIIGPPQAVWWYLSAAGDRLFAVVRYPKWDNGQPVLDDEGHPKKEIRTWCWARNNETGAEGWQCTRPPDHLPLYGLDRLAAHAADAVVLVVEGEKTADAVHQFIGGEFAVVTWCGGARNSDKPDKVDWSALAGRRVILWPDYDKVGALAMSMIAGHLTAAGVKSLHVVNLNGLEQRKPGWDGADGTAEDAEVIVTMTIDATQQAFAGMMDKLPGKLDDKALAEFGLKSSATGDKRPAPEAGKQGPGAGGPGKPPKKNGGGDGDDIEANDIAAATAFVEDHHRVVLYCPTWERWHVWDGKRWRGDDQGAVFRLAERTALRIARDYLNQGESARLLADENETKANATLDNKQSTPDQRAEALKLLESVEPLRKLYRSSKAKADQVQTLKRLKDMLDLAKTRAELVVEADELDADEFLFNTASGVVDLRDGRVYKHDSKRRITRLAPVEYDPKNPAPPGRLSEVLEHLCQVMGADGKVDATATAELSRFAQEVLGNSLQGNNRLERFYVWQGPGGSGKGTLMEAIKAATGDYTMTAEFQSFVRTQGTRVRDDLARLAEARVVFASETEEGEQLAAGVIKSITGRDTITARQLYGSYFEFRPRLTLHLQCNDLPRTNDQDSGLWRRLVLIPCGPQIPDEKRDPGLKTWLLDPETGGKAVLAWLIAGAIRTHSLKHLVEPTVVKAATAAYRVDQDPTREFFAEALRFACALKHQDTRCAVTDVLKAYTRWCDDNALSPRLRCSPRTIAQRLEARGCYRGKIRLGNLTPSVWFGLTVPQQVESDGTALVLVQSAHVPTTEEHEAALASVPVFLSSNARKTPTRARTPAPLCDDSSKIEEQKNTGTDGQPPRGSAGPSSPADGTNPPEEPPPTDATGIDLETL